MRSITKIVLFVMIAVLLLTPSSGYSVGGDGGAGCQTCYNYFDPQTGLSWSFCAEPRDGEWGQTDCSVDCIKYGEGMGVCACSTSGWSCLYIVVQG